MLPEIGHHVHKRIAYFARRRQRSSVIPLAPHTAGPRERTVHGACDADGEPANPARERPSRIRFGDQMNVIVLDRKLNDPEILATGNGQGAAYVWEDTRRAQAADCLHSAQRHVDRLSGDVQRARAMRNAGPAPSHALAAGAGTSPAPRARGGQSKLNGTTTHMALIRLY